MLKSLLRTIEEKVFTGKILEDYGHVGSSRQGIVSVQRQVLLVHKQGKTQLAIRQKATAFLAFAVSYFFFDKETLLRLRSMIDDALTKM